MKADRSGHWSKLGWHILSSISWSKKATKPLVASGLMMLTKSRRIVAEILDALELTPMVTRAVGKCSHAWISLASRSHCLVERARPRTGKCDTLFSSGLCAGCTLKARLGTRESWQRARLVPFPRPRRFASVPQFLGVCRAGSLCNSM